MCDIHHISKPSEVWCSDCNEGICTECLDHHSLAKPCRTHTPIPIAQYRKLPSYVLEIKEHCSDQTSDGLEIWRLSHIPQKDGELDMMLLSCNILLVLKYKITFINCHQSL
jgi:hypothetical protein